MICEMDEKCSKNGITRLQIFTFLAMANESILFTNKLFKVLVKSQSRYKKFSKLVS